MAITPVNLTYNLGDLLGIVQDAARTKVWIETNIDGDVIIDDDGNQIRLGMAKATTDSSGSGQFTGLIPTNADTNPTAFQYQVHIEYPLAYGNARPRGGGKDGRGVWTSGWFSLTATTNLADVVAEQYAPAVWQTEFMEQAQELLDQQEAISGLTGEDDAVALLINTPSSETAGALTASTADSIQPGEIDPQAAVDARVEIAGEALFAPVSGSPNYVTRTGGVTSLPTPTYWAHRGSAGVYPEATMAAFAGSAGAGATGLELDVQTLGDGTAAVMHDATVDRTTDKTGNVSSFTTPDWLTLNAAAQWPWNSRVERAPLWSEVLSTFGGNIPLLVEPKDTTLLAQLVADADRAGLQNHVIFEASTVPMLQAIKAAGYRAYYYFSTDISTLATVLAENPDYLGCATTASDGTITSLVATGKPVWPYTVIRRVDAARLIALGCAGMIADQPHYVKRTTAIRTTDSWRNGVYGQGLCNSDITPTRSTIVASALRLKAPGTQYAVIGEVCPIAAAAGSYTINLDLGFSTLPADTTRWVGGVICASDDSQFINSGITLDGYHFLLRANGSLQLFKLTKAGGGNVQVGSTVSTTALSAGVLAHLTIAVTPTGITLTRTDSGGFTAVSTSDATHRGGYLHLGKTSTDGIADFKTLAIT